jgi:pimeloyl-ACP methyl ester carboxylesterase
MSLARCVIVFVHGLFSSGNVWGSFERLIGSDPALKDFDILGFEYASPRFNLSPLRRIPDFNVLADSLETYLRVEARDYSVVVLVSHSQGGLIVQRYIHRMIAAGRGHELERIRGVVLFACPNSGSEVFLTLRRTMVLWRNPQESALRPINEAVTEAQQAILNRVVHATSIAADQCPINIVAYAGDSDNVVTPTSARGVFPRTGVIPGDHFTIIRPDSSTHRSYTTLRSELLAILDSTDSRREYSGSDATLMEPGAQPPSEPKDSSANESKLVLDRMTMAEVENEQVVVRWNPTLRTVDFILSPQTALSWVRELSEGQTDE